MCGQHHQDEKKDRSRRQDNIDQNVLSPNCSRVIHVAGPIALFNNDLLQVSKVVSEFMCTGVAMHWCTLQSTVNDFLHLQGDRWFKLARRGGILELRLVHVCEEVIVLEGRPAGKHFVEDYADGVDIAAS